jgi:host factor-I protein
MKPQSNLQDLFLNQVRKENVPVTIFLVNGYQLKGLIRAFDNFTVILETDGKQQLVYKHALSTLVPMRSVNLMREKSDDQTEMTDE